MKKPISLRQLEIFAAVTRHVTVTRAASELGLSQSAVSMTLAELEKQLGERLFDRLGKKLLLNERGRSLLPRVEEILCRVDEIGHLFAQSDGGLEGQLKVGTSSTVGNYLLPRMIGNFAANYPAIRILLEVGNTAQVIQALLRFDIDLGIIEGYCHDAAVETILWRRDRLAVFAGKDHPLACRKKVTAADLAEAGWILRERGSGTREVFEAAVAGKIDRISVLLELGHTEAIKQAVAAGLGISCLSVLALEQSLAAGTVVELETPFLNLERFFSILMHKEKYRTAVLRQFLEFCMENSA